MSFDAASRSVRGVASPGYARGPGSALVEHWQRPRADGRLDRVAQPRTTEEHAWPQSRTVDGRALPRLLAFLAPGRGGAVPLHAGLFPAALTGQHLGAARPAGHRHHRCVVEPIIRTHHRVWSGPPTEVGGCW